MKTSLGAIMSMFILCLAFLFALLKLQHLLTRSSPSVSKFVEDEAFDGSTVYNTASDDFMMAFAVENYLTGPKYDPTYFNWVTVHSIITDGVLEEQYYPMHLCSEEEINRLHTPMARSANKLEMYKNNGMLACADW